MFCFVLPQAMNHVFSEEICSFYGRRIILESQALITGAHILFFFLTAECSQGCSGSIRKKVRDSFFFVSKLEVYLH